MYKFVFLIQPCIHMYLDPSGDGVPSSLCDLFDMPVNVSFGRVGDFFELFLVLVSYGVGVAREDAVPLARVDDVYGVSHYRCVK